MMMNHQPDRKWEIRFISFTSIGMPAMPRSPIPKKIMAYVTAWVFAMTTLLSPSIANRTFTVGYLSPVEAAVEGGASKDKREYDEYLSPVLEKLFAYSKFKPSAFDVKSKARELGRGVNDIFEFVRDRVEYEAYSGVLRGARGTLMGLAGNSIDQSILLAALLREHGFKTRFVKGTLANPRARALIDRLIAKGRTLPDKQAISAANVSKQVFLENLFEEVAGNFDLVKKMLEEKKVALPKDSGKGHAKLANQAKDHYWVQYNENGKWIDLDATFRSAKAGDKFSAEVTILRDGFPSSLRHRVKISVILEYQKSNTLKVKTVFQKEFPSEKIAGSSIIFTNMPNRLDEPSKADAYMPLMVIDGTSLFGEGFDITGKKVSESEFAPGLGAISGILRQSLGKAVGRKATLTAEWLEFEIISPVGNTKYNEKVRREIFDRVGPILRSKGKILDASLEKFDFISHLSPVLGISIVSGSVPLEYSLHVAKGMGDRDGLKFNSAFFGTLNNGYLLMRSAVRSQSDLPYKSYFYRPNIIITSVRLKRTNIAGNLKIVWGIDLRKRNVRVLPSNPESVLFDGILDVITEKAYMQNTLNLMSEKILDVSRVNITAITEGAEERRIPMVAVTKKEIDKIEKLAIPDIAKLRVKEAVRGGNLVILPETPVEIAGAKHLGWWKVDLATGETTDELQSGIHGTLSEYVINLAQVPLRLISTIRKFCRSILNRMFFLIAWNIAMWWFTAGFGGGPEPLPKPPKFGKTTCSGPK